MRSLLGGIMWAISTPHSNVRQRHESDQRVSKP
jgi:hypothetical protein